MWGADWRSVCPRDSRWKSKRRPNNDIPVQKASRKQGGEHQQAKELVVDRAASSSCERRLHLPTRHIQIRPSNLYASDASETPGRKSAMVPDPGRNMRVPAITASAVFVKKEFDHLAFSPREDTTGMDTSSNLHPSPRTLSPAPPFVTPDQPATTRRTQPRSSSYNSATSAAHRPTHLRSRSSNSATVLAPQMTRAHSLPNPQTLRLPTPTQPPRSPGSPGKPPPRTRSPFNDSLPPPRSPGFTSSSMLNGGGIESIPEAAELDLNARAPLMAPLPATAAPSSFGRSGSLRRRPASPLHSLALQQQQQQAQASAESTSYSSTIPSPSLAPQRYTEAYPSSLSLHSHLSNLSLSNGSAYSSYPSTPTSARSRSPSIASLDTLDEAPDAEDDAEESERLEGLKLAAERQERLDRGDDDSSGDDNGGSGSGRRRGSLDQGRGFGFARLSGGVGLVAGSGGGQARERKRWSICGGERRGDLDLETIWED